jgi:hemoglobin-like flavoprotein
MDAEQIRIIRLSMVKVMENKLAVGTMFYDRLFAIAPDTRAMFKIDIETQSQKLIDTLATAIGALREPQLLTPMLQGLAHRHVSYAVREEHYDKVGEALMYTLETALNTDFTPQLRDAWAALYGAVSTMMKQAAAGKSLPATA